MRDDPRDAAPALRTWLLGLGACVGMLALLPLSTSKATDAPAWKPARFQSVEATIQDLELTLRARKAILQDDALARQNLGVTVRERVAILWGTVATKDLSKRAEEFLRPVIGLQGVHNELRVDESAAPPAGVTPRQPTPLAEPVPTPESSSSRGAGAKHQQVWRPVLEGPSAPTVPGAAEMPGYSGETTRAARPPAQQEPPRQDGLAPRPRDPLVPTAHANRPLSLMAPVPLSKSREDAKPVNHLAQTVESLRLQDRRFQSLRADIAGAVVTLRGSAGSRDHLFEFAQIISRVPGVERVVVEEVRPNPSSLR